MFRIAVWSQSRWIIGLLVLIILGHWSLILQGAQLTATWVPGTGCAIIKTNSTVLAATFIYTMVFDLVVMILNLIKLSGRKQRSQLVSVLFKDGVIYFIIASVFHMPVPRSRPTDRHHAASSPTRLRPCSWS